MQFPNQLKEKNKSTQKSYYAQCSLRALDSIECVIVLNIVKQIGVRRILYQESLGKK